MAQETNVQVAAVSSTGNETRLAYPCIRWMNGEEQMMPTQCATVADVRAEVCGLREVLWGEVVLMTPTYRVLLDDADPIPEDARFIAVIKPNASADTGASSGVNASTATTIFNTPMWELSIRNHCLYGQGHLVQKAVARVHAANDSVRADHTIDNDNVYHLDPNLLFSNVWDNVVDSEPDKVRTVLRILIRCGWDVNFQWNNRSNRLHTACRRGQTDIVQAIVEEGKDVVDIHRTYWDSMMQMEHTALSIAVYFNRRATATYLVTRSSEHPYFDVNRCHQVRLFTNHQNALHLAADWGKADMVNLLLTHDGDPSLADDNDDTPLHLCARRGAADKSDESYRRIAELLLDRKVNVHCKNAHGIAPLDYGDNDEQWLRTVMRTRRAQSVDSRDTEQYTADTACATNDDNMCVDEDAGVTCAADREVSVPDAVAGSMQPSGDVTTNNRAGTRQWDETTNTVKKRARGTTKRKDKGDMMDSARGARKKVRVSETQRKDTSVSAKVKGTAKQADDVKIVRKKDTSGVKATAKGKSKATKTIKKVWQKGTSSVKVKGTAKLTEAIKKVSQKDTSSANGKRKSKVTKMTKKVWQKGTSAKVKGTAKLTEPIKKVSQKGTFSAKVKGTAKLTEAINKVCQKGTSSAKVFALQKKKAKVMKKRR